MQCNAMQCVFSPYTLSNYFIHRMIAIQCDYSDNNDSLIEEKEAFA